MFDNRGPMMGAAYAEENSDLNEGTDMAGDAALRQNETLGTPIARAGGGNVAPASVLDAEVVLEAEERDGVLFVSGDIDLYEAGRFRTFADSYITTTDAPRIDLTDVSFIDSAGLAALLMLSRDAKAKGKTLTVVAAGAPRRVLRITGIDQAISVEG